MKIECTKNELETIYSCLSNQKERLYRQMNKDFTENDSKFLSEIFNALYVVKNALELMNN